MKYLAAITSAATLYLSLFISNAGAGELAPIEQQMPPQQFKASGLHKLSDKELASLNQWLQGKNAKREASAAATAKDKFGLKQLAPEPDILTSRIKGEFRGWRGGSTFRLSNGQIWKQRGGTSWQTLVIDPEVAISRNTMGFYVMEIVGTGRSTGVKRVK